jgi:DNA gyrase subunit B
MSEQNSQSSEYRGDAIQVLKGLEPVRKRPGMYVGGTDAGGFHHCLWEIIDNSVDEAMAGHCNNIDVVMHKDGSVSIQDNGRGIPVDIHPGEGIPTATVVFTVLHAGGKFDNSNYKVSGGLHGVGASVANALATKLEVLIKRDGKKWKQTFSNGGKPESDLVESGTTNRTGTFVRFWPDMGIFDDDCEFEEERIIQRLKTTGFLNPGLTLTLTNEIEGTEKKTFVAGSFSEMLDDICDKSGKPQGYIIEGERTEEVEGEGEVEVSLALRWHERNGRLVGFANTIPTSDGQHITGLRAAATRALNAYAQANNMVRQGQTFTSDDVQAGMIAAVSVKVPEPKFAGQTKEKLTNPGVQGVVSRATQEAVTLSFEENPDHAKRIIERVKLAQKAREAADKAHDLVVERKSAISRTALPGKLADCQEQDPTRSEVFVVEGDSAGGSAKQGRDREYQAILPLKGKILNTYRAETSRILKSEEVKNIILALGCGTKSNLNLNKLRYHKIIILADADSDGAHIATLALTFFHVYLPEIIEAGYIYVALPPLYRVRKGKTAHYLKDQAELDKFLAGRDDVDKGQVQRFKGLGEMNPDQLWEAAMDPETRRLGRVSYGEEGREGDDLVFDLLMGSDVPPRRKFIEEKAELANVDL